MIEAQTSLFKILDDYCAARGEIIRNSSKIRYISGPTKVEKDFLIGAKACCILQFNATRRVILYEFQGKSYICLVGFENAKEFSTLKEESLTGGVFTAVISDLSPKPIGTIAEIRNIVEAQDKSSNKSYIGHDVNLIGQLFPKVKIFSNELISDEQAYRIFLRFCLVECDYGDYWLNESLVGSLIALCDLGVEKIPYQTLCRSIFDADPGALYLGLYRCIEALYSFKIINNLAFELEIEKNWSEFCAIIESRLGWRAPEAASLNDLISGVGAEIFAELYLSLGLAINPSIAISANAAGKQIYKLRNALVHFRPIHQQDENVNIDWNRLCIVMTFLVKHIYDLNFSRNLVSGTGIERG